MRGSGENITQGWGERIASFLRSIHPYATAKLVARDAKVPVRTVEKWLDGTSAPSLDHFMRVLAAYAPDERRAMEARILEVQAKRRHAIDTVRGLR